MATNWSAYEAAKEIMGNNKENIAEIGSRFPLFTRITGKFCQKRHMGKEML